MGYGGWLIMQILLTAILAVACVKLGMELAYREMDRKPKKDEGE